MVDTLEYAAGAAFVVAVAYLLSWLLAAVLLTGTAKYETCDSGARYEKGLEDWHMVGPWPIATNYVCGER